MTSEFAHTPVLLSETIAALQPRPGGRYIDATLGRGGHAERVLELSRPDGMVLGIDADPTATDATREHLARFTDRLVLVNTYFDELEPVAKQNGFDPAEGVLFDLGVSSPQLNNPERGFSFLQDAPLDMRFGPAATATAEELINRLSGAELARILAEYGEERYASRIARRIVADRRSQPIRTTRQLATLVERAVPRSRSERIHPATRVFQALRIAVNDELGRLQRALPQALHVLDVGGRLAVISFHSLEDRIVKQFMRREAQGCLCPPDVPSCVCGHSSTVRILTAKPIVASADEVAVNPRARSAKLRVAQCIESQ